jgi:hypothetical protein
MSSILPITLFATLYPNEALANAQNPMSASLLLLTPLLSGFIRKRALGSHYQEASLDVLQNPNQRGLDSVLEAIPSLANAISAYVATISGPASLMFFIPVVSTLARSLRAQHRMRQYALAENTAIERWRNRCGTINRWTIALCVATVLVTVVLRVVNSEEDAAFASSRLWIVIPLVIMTLFRFVVDLFCSNSRGNQETLVTDISEGEISTMSDVGTQFPERFSSNDDLAEERLVEEALPPYLFYRRVSSTFIGRESEENVDTIDSL